MSTAPIARLVVIAPNWLGDAIMALPTIGDVRRHFSSAHLTVAAREGLAQLFECVSGVDDVMVLGPPGRRGLFRRVAEDGGILASGRFDLAVLLPNSHFSAWVAYRAGIRERWGYATDWRSRLLTRAIRPPRRPDHQAAYYRELGARLGIAHGPLAAGLRLPSEARRQADALLEAAGVGEGETLVGIAPGAAYGAAKQWPPRHFARLVDDLGRSSCRAVLVGSAHDRSASEDIERCLESTEARAALVDLTGRTSLPVLLALMVRCRAFVSNDSGAMHAASALGIPVVALFGATDEHRTGPVRWDDPAAPCDVVTAPVWCRPCLLRECPIDHRCMIRIDSARVADAVRRHLAVPAKGLH